MLLAVGAPEANAQVIYGTTYTVRSEAFTFPDMPAENWFNVAMSGDGDSLWFAAETYPPAAPELNGETLVIAWDGSLNTVTATSTLGQPEDFSSGGAVFPSIAILEGQIAVVSKQDYFNTSGDPPNPQIKVFYQNWALTSTPDEELLTVDPQRPYIHNKPVIAADDSDLEYLCWTREEESDPAAQDMAAAAKTHATWGTSDRNVVSGTSEAEDHCDMAFWGANGTRYLVYHRDPDGTCDDDEGNCMNGVDDDGDNFVDETEDELFVKIARYDEGPQTWFSGPHFDLLGSTGANFPTIWVEPLEGGAPFTSHFAVAAQGYQQNAIHVWECQGSMAQCDDSSDFTRHFQAIDLGLGVAQPKIFDIRDGSAVHTFVAYEKREGDLTVRLAVMCDTDSIFHDQGTLPLPAQYANGTDMVLGHTPVGGHSASNPQVHTDGDDFWITFLAQDPDDQESPPGGGPPVLADNARFFDIMVYKAKGSDFCGP